jgi:3-oxoacyl-[acyl-carrier protein] reductase
MARLDGKVALVTGSTRGIGEATARLLAEQGAAVTVTGRNRERGEVVAKSIEADGGTAQYVPADIGTRADVETLVEAAVARFGRLDVLVNNAAPTEAMGMNPARLTDVSWDEFDEVMRIGLYGSVWACRYALPHMQAAGAGSIVNISSTAAVQGVPGLPAYSCAKGALTALTRQLAVDYARDNIRVNTIVLGIIQNELTSPLKAVPGLVDAMHEMHLAGDDGGFLTGTELRVDGGVSIKAHVPASVVRTGIGPGERTASH